MKKKRIDLVYFCILWFLTSVFTTRAQEIEAFNALYTKTYLETALEDFPRALHIADSLFSVSETPLLQSRSLMLTATLYQQKGETIKSIEYALKAEKIINPTTDAKWKTRIYGFLATQYRIARLFVPAKEYVEKAKKIAEDIKDPQSANTVLGMITQEMAHHEMALKHYHQAIAYIQQAQKYFNHTQQNRDFFEAQNEQLLGLNYYLLQDKDKALTHYENALYLSTNSAPNYVTALIHNGIANIYLDQDDLLKAKEQLSYAQDIARQSNYLQLEKEVNETAYKYYARTNDISQMLAIKAHQDSILAQIYQNSADFLNDSYVMLGIEKEQLGKQSKSGITLLVMGILVVFPILLYFVLPPFKQHRQSVNNTPGKKRRSATPSPRVVVKEQEPEDEEMLNIEQEDGQDLDDEGAHGSAVPEQVVHKILIRLEEFEKKHLYIKSNLSLSYLGIYCDTNTKYLSIVINAHKKKDFYNYINELRINYIVEKLENNAYYRRLKISALATEAGFSSQSKFALNFKKVTGMSPSDYIKSLEEE